MLCQGKTAPKITLQVLAYPVVDYYAEGTNSYKTFADYYPGGVTTSTLEAAWDFYLGNVTYNLSNYRTVTCDGGHCLAEFTKSQFCSSSDGDPGKHRRFEAYDWLVGV
jgi:hypothetical protein